MKTIHHVVDIQASLAKVWWALTDHAGLTGWWSTMLDTPPAAVGVDQVLTFVGDFNPIMRITALRPEAAVEWLCVGGHDYWDNSTFRFELATLDGGRTRLRFWQEYEVEVGDDAYGTYNFLWGYYLESLHLLCETGTGKPSVVEAP